jgi:hypothetical protein
MYSWDFTPVLANADLLALGLLNTLKLTGTALAFGVPLGLLLALMRLSSTQCAVVVREAGFAVRPGSVAWNQWRLSPTRNAAAVNGPAATPLGTRNLSEVYAYPNPARGGATTIHYRLQSPADAVRIQIFDPAGSLIAEPPVDAADRAGSAEHAVVWNHAAMSSGIYICRVEVASAAGTEIVLTRLAVLR